MTNPIRRQIQEHPACDTHRPRPHAEGFLRRSGREVECTPLLRVQVRIRASGVRIPPSPPGFVVAEGFQKGVWVLPQFLPQFCQRESPEGHPPRDFFRAFSLALVEPGFNRSPRTSDRPVGRVGEVFRADRIERSECLRELGGSKWIAEQIRKTMPEEKR